MYRKGTILIRKRVKSPKHGKNRLVILPLHEDMIQDTFWEKNKEILEIKTAPNYDWPDDTSFPDLVLDQLHINKD